MISQAFQACYSVEDCLSDCCILSLDQVGYRVSLLNNPTTSLRTQKSAIRRLSSPWDGGRCQDSITFLLGSLSVILKVQTDETQLKINKKRNSFFFQPLSLLSSMTLPCGHDKCHLPILHAYWSWPYAPTPPPYFTPTQYPLISKPASFYSKYNLETCVSAYEGNWYSCCSTACLLLDWVQ